MRKMGDDLPECGTCQCPLTVKHILIECVDLNDVRNKHFVASSFFLSYLGWHTLPSHAGAEACEGSVCNPRERTSVVLRNTTGLT